MQAPPAYFGRNFTKTLHNEPYEATNPSKVTLPDGYTVLITGAGKGIGEYIAKAYAHAAASNIIILARTAQDLDKVKIGLEEIASKNGRKIKVMTVPSDVSKEGTCIDLKQLIESQYDGRLDCLINNAGTIGSKQGFNNKFHETDAAEHAQILDLNYLSCVYSCKHLIPLILQSPRKTIINITSMASHVTSNNPIAYGVSKLAVNRLTQHIGENYAEEGIDCMALHPGAVMTPAAQHVPEFLQKSEFDLCQSSSDTLLTTSSAQGRH